MLPMRDICEPPVRKTIERRGVRLPAAEFEKNVVGLSESADFVRRRGESHEKWYLWRGCFPHDQEKMK